MTCTCLSESPPPLPPPPTNDEGQAIEPVQGAADDVLHVNWSDILEFFDETGVTNWLAQVRAARASLPPASDRSATMMRLQEMFGSRQRLKRIAGQFPRSIAEYFADFS